MSGAPGKTSQPWTFGVRVIANQIDRAKWRNTLTYRFHPIFSAGIEYNPLAGRVSPLANLLLMKETRHRPALIAGTSSDRIGTPSGQSFYATFSKNLKRETRLPIAPYAGAAYGTYQHRWRAIGGLNIGFTERLTALVIFDGVHVHPLLNYSYGRHTFSFILVRGRHPGMSYSIGF